MYIKKSLLLSSLLVFGTSTISADSTLDVEKTTSVITYVDLKEDYSEKSSDTNISLPKGIRLVSKKEALETDINIVAESRDLAVEDVSKAIAFQKSFSAYVNKLLETYPEQISLIYVEKLPATRGHIVFVDEVPNELIESVKTLKQENKIILKGGGKFSIKEHHKRALEVSKSLAKKYDNMLTYFDQTQNTIQVEIQVALEDLAPTKEELLIPLQEDFKKSELKKSLKELKAKDFKVKILRGKGPIMTPDYSRGGSEVFGNGSCTLGWTVDGPNGNGVITAGHCNEMTYLQDHINGNIYSMTFRDRVYGSGGDVAYYTTPTTAELPVFFATSNPHNIREVYDIQTTNTMVGNTVCLYGRASDIRSCHDVEAINVTVTMPNGTQVGSLARTDGTSSIGGDSGGGWSWTTTAWGINKGHDSSGHGYFTPIEAAQSALDITILEDD